MVHNWEDIENVKEAPVEVETEEHDIEWKPVVDEEVQKQEEKYLQAIAELTEEHASDFDESEVPLETFLKQPKMCREWLKSIRCHGVSFESFITRPSLYLDYYGSTVQGSMSFEEFVAQNEDGWAVSVNRRKTVKNEKMDALFSEFETEFADYGIPMDLFFEQPERCREWASKTSDFTLDSLELFLATKQEIPMVIPALPIRKEKKSVARVQKVLDADSDSVSSSDSDSDSDSDSISSSDSDSDSSSDSDSDASSVKKSNSVKKDEFFEGRFVVDPFFSFKCLDRDGHEGNKHIYLLNPECDRAYEAMETMMDSKPQREIASKCFRKVLEKAIGFNGVVSVQKKDGALGLVIGARIRAGKDKGKRKDMSVAFRAEVDGVMPFILGDVDTDPRTFLFHWLGKTESKPVVKATCVTSVDDVDVSGTKAEVQARAEAEAKARGLEGKEQKSFVGKVLQKWLKEKSTTKRN
jgi:hypothetical protein